jgi:hypothetical protein
MVKRLAMILPQSYILSRHQSLEINAGIAWDKDSFVLPFKMGVMEVRYAPFCKEGVS